MKNLLIVLLWLVTIACSAWCSVSKSMIPIIILSGIGGYFIIWFINKMILEEMFKQKN